MKRERVGSILNVNKAYQQDMDVYDQHLEPRAVSERTVWGSLLITVVNCGQYKPHTPLFDPLPATYL
jgi:hypothetical protein